MEIHRRMLSGMLAGVWGLSFIPKAFALAKMVEVTMKQGAKPQFDPDTVRIAVGDSVKWTNSGYITHSVTFDPKMASKPGDVVLPSGVAPFDSGNIEEDGTFTHTFSAKGTYKYVCKFHEAMGMVGTVIVT
jgi:plastocyanin